MIYCIDFPKWEKHYCIIHIFVYIIAIEGEFMHIISKKALIDFLQIHGDAKTGLELWYAIAKSRNWNDFNEMKRDFPSADLTGGRWFVFNIGGNKYRLVTVIDFQFRKCFIRKLLTHAEYSKITDITKL